MRLGLMPPVSLSQWDADMAIQSSVTISLVPEARGGPFIFWDDLEDGCRKAKALGFDAVEVFPPARTRSIPAGCEPCSTTSA